MKFSRNYIVYLLEQKGFSRKQALDTYNANPTLFSFLDRAWFEGYRKKLMKKVV